MKKLWAELEVILYNMNIIMIKKLSFLSSLKTLYLFPNLRYKYQFCQEKDQGSSTKPASPELTPKDFSQIDIRIGEILECSKVNNFSIKAPSFLKSLLLENKSHSNQSIDYFTNRFRASKIYSFIKYERKSYFGS